MARQARKGLADMRALEEERARMTMRGSGHYIGAGATPSMGLSQFRGGRYSSSESDSESDEEMSGGRKHRRYHRRGGLSIREIPHTSTAIVPYHAPSASRAIVPYHAPSTSLTPFHQYTPHVTTLSTGRAAPSYPASWYASHLYGTPHTTAISEHIPTAAPRTAAPPSSSMLSRIGMALSAGIPLAALGLGLGGVFDQPSGSQPSDSQSGNSQIGTDMGLPDMGPIATANPDMPSGYTPGQQAPGTGAPGGPLYSGPGYGGPGYSQPDFPTGPGGVPPGLSQNELSWYLQSGNLPDRYYSGSLSQRKAKYGKGKKVTHSHDGRSARAEIVRKVMRDHGLSLPKASKYVKDHGLY